MSNSYRGQDNKNSSSVSNAGFVLIGIALLMVVIVLVLLCARCAKQNSSSDDVLNYLNPLTCTISAQDSTGKDVTDSLTVIRSSNTPSDVNPEDATLVNIDWSEKKVASYPMVLTIQDSSYTDGQGLIVFQYKNGQWEQIDTYMISNASVSFPVESLGDFAFILYDRYMAGLNPEPEETEEPELSPSPSTSPTGSPSPSPSPSPSASPTSKSNQSNSTNGNSENVYGTATPVPVTTSNQDTTTPAPTYNPGGQTSAPATAAPVEPDPVVDPTSNPDEGGGDSGGGDATATDSGGGTDTGDSTDTDA